MAATKVFRPEFKTRDGRKVSFGANYTHDTKAKRRAGLTTAGRPKVETVGAGTVVRSPRRWLPWAVFGTNSAVLGGTWAVAELGPAVGGLVVGVALWAGYRIARWTAGSGPTSPPSPARSGAVGRWPSSPARACRRRRISRARRSLDPEPAITTRDCNCSCRTGRDPLPPGTCPGTGVCRSVTVS